MKNHFTSAICIVLILFSTPAYAKQSTPKETSQNYSWDLTDENQRAVATHMLTFGILMTTAAILTSLFIPNSTTGNDKITTGKASSE